MVDPLFLFKLSVMAKSYFTKEGPATSFNYRTNKISEDSLRNSKLVKQIHYLSGIFVTEIDAIRVVTLSCFWDGNIVHVTDHLLMLRKQALFLDTPKRSYELDLKKIRKKELGDGTIFMMLMEEKINPFTFAILNQKYPEISASANDMLKKKYVQYAPKLLVSNGLMTPEKKKETKSIFETI